LTTLPPPRRSFIAFSIARSSPLIIEPPPASSTRFFSLSWNSGSKLATSLVMPLHQRRDDQDRQAARICVGEVERRRLAVDRQLDDRSAPMASPT
jgi:hypothetical protein